MSTLEVILRTLGVGQLVGLAVILLRTRRRDQTARIGAALCVSVAAFMLTSMPGAAHVLGVIVYPLTALCATHPVWFWIFCAALFADGFHLGRGHILCLIAMAVVGVLHQGPIQTSLPGASPAFVGVIGVAFGAASLAFVALGPLAVQAGGRTDLDDRRRRIRAWFVPAASIYLAAVVAVQAWASLAGRLTPEPLVIANLAIIVLLAGLALLSFLRIRMINWLEVAAPPSSGVHSLTLQEQRVLEQLTRRFASDRLYAHPGLSVAGLAKLLGTQEHVLRRVINRGLGFRNFNDFLHTHRLREAAGRLRDPASRCLPVLTIALDVGYGSIGPFNRAFRERFGVTPSEYRRETADAVVRDIHPGVPTQPSPR